ncbi:hypothetical protein D9619_012413 [Psilocybe cf. subviscida]|uniref:Ras-domain-containing protein n=1 Tax=Psilocybe cf. subviscida TaxID=2480587 RepID=A0A8H5ARZ9_9AGAR|nr:hypothetical protein D9619_012413 [Psilocybe cf. subviscida]
MPTVKLVVIGSSGVGKTSLRGKYIEGRFSNGYRATIGADFITKTLPHPTKPELSVTLQIWDTAGQERFSSLSTAFFRGADAALLMFDVNAPETMLALRKWWQDFCDRAPLDDAAVSDYCCVVVGNKTDMAGKAGGAPSVSPSEALAFLDELVPASPVTPDSASPLLPLPPNASIGSPVIPPPSAAAAPPPPSPSPSITIIPALKNSPPAHRLSTSTPRSRSSSRFYPGGTMTTTHTTLSIYHTPSSSMFDVYQSARSSPEPHSLPGSPSPPRTGSGVGVIGGMGMETGRRRTTTMLSNGSASSSAPTITPSLFARSASQSRLRATSPAAESESDTEEASPTPTPTSLSTSTPLPTPNAPPLPPDRGPKLFFTSAKTGDGVRDVFEYIARRVVLKWEHDEWAEARVMHFRDASGATTSARAVAETIRLRRDQRPRKVGGECCGS